MLLFILFHMKVFFMNLKLSEASVEKIKSIFNEQNVSNDSVYLRVGIKGFSCSGPMYAFYLDEDYDPDVDEVLIQDDIKIICEKDLVKEFYGITINYHEQDGRNGFSFDNPLKTISGCKSGGCCSNGTSCENNPNN